MTWCRQTTNYRGITWTPKPTKDLWRHIAWLVNMTCGFSSDLLCIFLHQETQYDICTFSIDFRDNQNSTLNFSLDDFEYIFFINNVTLLSWCLKSPTNRLFVQHLAQANIKKYHQGPALRAFFERWPVGFPSQSQQYWNYFLRDHSINV